MIYSLVELVNFAKTNSEYYKQLYRSLDLSTDFSATFAFSEEQLLRALPIVNQKQFWQANSLSQNQLLTAPLSSAQGVVFKSGGTSGQPKLSAFTMEEWETFTDEFARGVAHLPLSGGERVANLFYAGNLYASFLFIMRIEKFSGRVRPLRPNKQ